MKTLFHSVHAVMARRILVNFRVRPEAIARLLPHPFRPKLVNDWGMAGICLIRLEDTRPIWLPQKFGIASENAAHRIAVEWTENGRILSGVFIPRRDTNSLLNHFAGGRLFPGIHHHAHFDCNEKDGCFEVTMCSDDGETRVNVKAHITNNWPAGSVFKSLAEASVFFQTGGCGWSPARDRTFEGVELHTEEWGMQPLEMECAESSFFSKKECFPAGSVEFDSALLMRGIRHQWHALGKVIKPQPQIRSHHSPAAFYELP